MSLPPDLNGQGYSVTRAFAVWLEIRARNWVSPATVYNYTHMAQGWCHVIGDRAIGGIRPIDIQELYRSRDNGRRSVAYLNKERETLHAFFEWARGLDLIRGNPVTRASWPFRHGPGKRVFVQITTEILGAILDLTNPRYHRLFMFLFITALRIGESLQALWSWVVQDPRDPESWILRVPDTARKQRVGYIVPLSPRIMEILGPRGKEGERIFKEVPSQSSIRKTLRLVGRRLGIPHLSPHQFRRSCATNLVNAGMPLPAVQRFVGWKQAPRDWLRMFEDSYYLGIEAPEARRIQEQLWPRRQPPTREPEIP